MVVTLFTTHCPRCKVVQMKLLQKNIKFTECEDIEEMKKFGISTAPILKVDDNIYDFTKAIAWINSVEKQEVEEK